MDLLSGVFITVWNVLLSVVSYHAFGIPLWVLPLFCTYIYIYIFFFDLNASSQHDGKSDVRLS